MSETAAFWSGEFGNAYLRRNRVDWRRRIPFWRGILDMTGARSVYEVGCNAGWNLSALKRAHPDVVVAGHDINPKAALQARCAGLPVEAGTPDWIELADPAYELAFTAGVLIHIAPCDLPDVMQNIVGLSCDWVLSVEYEADKEEEVEYRGHAGKLWRRPYGRLYEAMGLTKEWEGPAGPMDGFDNCHAVLLRKRP